MVPAEDARDVWYLEGFLDQSQRLRRVPIQSLPFRIGRRPGLEMTVGSTLVSHLHAEIVEEEGTLKIRDLGSTNGTFLNLDRLAAEAPLKEGDILHVAQLELRVGRRGSDAESRFTTRTTAVHADLPEPQVNRSIKLRELLNRGAVSSVFQPIVVLDSERLVGYEVLGRGAFEGLPRHSSMLFHTAQLVGAEAELSRLFRSCCLDDCLSLPGDRVFFMNTHPAELGTAELESSLRQLREAAPRLRVAIEIHEAAITDPPTIQRLRELLQELDMLLAYDDFGAGRTRLRELAEATPDYLKFDLQLIRGIDRAEPARRKLLASLAGIACELGIAPVAEGLETETEAAACRELGFELGQGFLYGAPEPAESVRR